MSRLTRLLPLIALPAALFGCASSTPTVDIEPVEASPAYAPMEWFVEQWGPIPEHVVATYPTPGVAGYQPLIVDGIHMPFDLEGRGLAGMTGLARDDIEKIFLVRCNKGGWMFGELAMKGRLIMVFTKNWEGPMPILEHRAETPCERGSP